MTAAAIVAPQARGFLYRLSFPNGKSYIGITTRTVAVRFAEHVAYAANGKIKGAIHRAITKYGACNVSIETLASAGWDYLKELEVKAISAYGTRPPCGYNLTRGGDGVIGFDDVTRAKMGAKNIGRKPDAATRAKLSASSTGRGHHAEARAKISAARTGMKFSEEHRKNLSKARREIVASGKDFLTAEGRARLSAASRAARLGIPRSEETRAKLSAANLGKKASAETKAKQSAALKGRPRAPEVMARIVASRQANKFARLEAGIIDERVPAWTGRKHSAESLEKMRKAHSGKKQSHEVVAKRVAASAATKLARLTAN